MQWLAVILVLPYLYMLLGIYRGLRRLKVFRPAAISDESVSVIVACRNEQKNLPLLLNDLLSQHYPEDSFEVIIIDDNSTDRTFEIASGFTAIKNITVIKNPGSGKKEAIRAGVNISKNALIITTDADCRMGNEWMRAISSFYEKSRADMIVCPVEMEQGKGFFGKFRELEFLSLQGVTAGAILSGNSTMCNGANLAFKRDVYLINQETLHPELSSGDDVFLLHSIKKNPSLKIEWLEAKEAVVTTGSDPSVVQFLKQRRRWISKAGAYDDLYTILLGFVTFFTIIIQIVTLAAGFVNCTFIYIYLFVLVLKSIPDMMILLNTTRRYGRSKLMAWFIPSQVVYPVYVLITAFFAFLIPRLRN
jgi:glycosyltransferase involved in cell wall biosynthesis